MMRNLLKVFLLVATIFNVGFCQNIVSKPWEYSYVALINESMSDTSILYSQSSSINLLNIGVNNILMFYPNKTFKFIVQDTIQVPGTWEILNSDLIFEGDTLEIRNMDTSMLSLQSPFVYLDTTTATFKNGFLLVEFKLINANVVSIKSGSWNDPSVWSNGQVPNKATNLRIKSPHSIILESGQLAFSRFIEIERGAVFDFSKGRVIAISPQIE